MLDNKHAHILDDTQTYVKINSVMCKIEFSTTGRLLPIKVDCMRAVKSISVFPVLMEISRSE